MTPVEPTSQPDAELVEVATLAMALAGEAAALVARRRAEGVQVEATKSSPVDVVTAVDRESEQLIRSRLAEARPGDGVLGEEDGSTPGSTGWRWVADPIDGTVNYLYGLPAYAVSLAAEKDGVVQVGVVVDVAAGATYHAVRGQGAFRDGARLRVRPTPPVAERLVFTGFNYEQHTRVVQAAAAAALLPRVRDLRRSGSCALDLCRIAEGAGDGYVEEGVSIWDHAAGALIAREAGARTLVTTGRGGKEAIVCAPADGFDSFLELVTSCGYLAAEEGNS